MEKISVIVPVYNVEKYIHKCVDSILNQTYQNIEVILVDDGSPDACGSICDEYAKNDSRVIVVHKENGGLSDARNAGLDIATGEYIAFVDSDDWIEPDAYEYLIKNAIRYKVKMAVGGVKVFDEKYNKYRKNYDIIEIEEKVLGKEEYIKNVFCSIWAAWDKIYHKSIFDLIRFPKGEFNEDEAIMLDQIEYCDTIFLSNKPIYVHYVRASESITAAEFNIKKIAWYEHSKANLDYIARKHPKLREYAEIRYFTSLLWCLNNMTRDKKIYKKQILRLRNILRNQIKNLFSNRYISKKEKCRAALIAYNYSIYILLVRIFRKKYT